MANPLNKTSARYMKELSITSLTVTVSKDNIYFTKETVELGKLVENQFIQFTDTSSTQWYFACSTEEDGFKLFKRKKNSIGLATFDRALVRAFLKQTNFTLKDLPLRFPVVKTTAFYTKFNGNNTTSPILYIDISKGKSTH